MEFKTFFVQDRQGNALPFAKANIVLAGTSVPATVYNRSGVEIGNPATADDQGAIGFSAVTGSYDVYVFEDPGVLTQTVLGVQFFDAVEAKQSVDSIPTQVAASLAASLDLANIQLPSPAYYIDSVDGNDANSGLSQQSPLKTGQAAMALIGENRNDADLNFKAGGRYRVEIDWKLNARVKVRGYGDFATLGLPMIDATDVVDVPWVSAASLGYPELWYIDWQHGVISGQRNQAPLLFKDDDMVDMAASIAACQGAAGSMYHDYPVNGELCRIFYNNGGTDPNSEGGIYSATRRHETVRLGRDSVMEWLHLHGAGNSLGSCVSEEGSINYRIATTGNLLHSYNGAPALRKHCGAYQPKRGPLDGGLIFEFYQEDGKNGVVVHEDCVAVGPPTRGTTDIVGFGGHFTTTSRGLRRMDLFGVSCFNCGIDVSSSDEALIDRPNVFNGGILVTGRKDGAKPEVRIVDPNFKMTESGVRNSVVSSIFAKDRNPAVRIEGLRLYYDIPGAAAFSSPSNLELTHSAVFMGPNSAGSKIFNLLSASQEANVHASHNIYFGRAGGQAIMDLRHAFSADGSYESDFNVIFPTGDNNTTGTLVRVPAGGGAFTSCYNIAAIRAASPFEAHSVSVDPGFVDPEAGDFRTAGAIPIAGVGLARPNARYTPIIKTKQEMLDWVIFGEVL